MCGILGAIRISGQRPSVGPEAAARMRDTMTARGPDGAGLWSADWALLAHRRLAVVDLSPGGDQPKLSPDGRHAIVYNGELYNDADLRAALSREGVLFRSQSDTETVLRALMQWGPAALERLRGMYALGYIDLDRKQALLARDPLGIKPLYYSTLHDGRELVFASDIRAILAHPEVPARPDPVTASAYLTTIRTVLGERTLFAGIRTLRPGQSILMDCSGETLAFHRSDHSQPPASDELPDPQVAAERTRRAITDSVRRHLRSDVPVCVLLSGGLDSTIIGANAAAEIGQIRTYCSGAAGDSAEPDDFAFARIAAAAIGSHHTEVPITREHFRDAWPRMIETAGLPLSTPNEVAIAAVATRLRADGMVVALSGEGADELFAGYELPMTQAAAFESARPVQHPGDFQLLSNAWTPPDLKPQILSKEFRRASEADAALFAHYREEFDALASGASEPLHAHLRFHQRINLAGLLQRLDTATMLASVEGRTPFADRTVHAFAESLPMSLKFAPASAGSPARTKIILRNAFADLVPPEILRRPKASFPLPFQSWLADNAAALHTSVFAREFFSPAARATIAADPARAWFLAWPAINLALWGKRWWG